MKTITTSMIYPVIFLHTLFAVFSYVMQFSCSAKAVPTSNYRLITPPLWYSIEKLINLNYNVNNKLIKGVLPPAESYFIVRRDKHKGVRDALV